jgi:DNA polymerase II small subunit/DNA polymerase delta subunit B
LLSPFGYIVLGPPDVHTQPSAVRVGVSPGGHCTASYSARQPSEDSDKIDKAMNKNFIMRLLFYFVLYGSQFLIYHNEDLKNNGLSALFGQRSG